ncbi:MAG: App1 family protein [Bacteroidota bacterium]
MSATLRARIVRIERLADRGVFRLRRRFGLFGPLHAYVYRGFGTTDDVWVTGRVLVDRGLEHATSEDSLWKNFRMSVKRFASDEIPGVRVRLSFAGATDVVTTDDEGYFTCRLHPSAAVEPLSLWHEVQAELLDPLRPDRDRIISQGEVQVPPSDCRVGIISDVDDTVIRTEATRVLTMLRLTLLHNAWGRVPFAGVSSFYRALQAGKSGAEQRPFFYVSSSPWNLYDLLVDIFDIQDMPRGTFFLRDLGFAETKKVGSKHELHKLAQIERVMDTYPGMRFVLIGDSGQKDPEIYRRVVKDFPGRVATVYIRDVRPGIAGARDDQVKAIAAELERRGVPMLLMPNTVEAARHAASMGLIDPARIAGIDVDRARDEGRFE